MIDPSTALAAGLSESAPVARAILEGKQHITRRLSVMPINVPGGVRYVVWRGIKRIEMDEIDAKDWACRILSSVP